MHGQWWRVAYICTTATQQTWSGLAASTLHKSTARGLDCSWVLSQKCYFCICVLSQSVWNVAYTAAFQAGTFLVWSRWSAIFWRVQRFKGCWDSVWRIQTWGSLSHAAFWEHLLEHSFSPELHPSLVMGREPSYSIQNSAREWPNSSAVRKIRAPVLAFNPQLFHLAMWT